ncbi:MAG: hemerythrin domain-containing protein [Candidatus Electrothrix sp. AW2]|jgi:hemerythrin-like domain-containing protein|nr:hemerythrin domain-containing protein [Candidatus Electrothrix sp. AX1]MCI5136444.1 hemerythrin domain-containing protein [Candidatus Electrothrix gigas]MCI5180357.1 hemerythrin domain-containing protein [Candidatus Electrothrix gigas]MCI5181593.1 hemerythrin domain-containing protein [Candidatus Electrothrix gigas]MCI5190940.1 hemerythrin domain-containing protein [Candidatus Electrothrix gigas]
MKKERMDKLTREACEHGKIIESMVFFENFLKAITNNDVENYLEKLHKFSDEYIVDHFRFEEQEVFPLLLEQGSAEEKKFVQELLEDHEQILASLAEFKKTISSCSTKPNREEIKHIIKSSETVVSKIILHARKEDKRLFPVLKKM